ncbi:unnamed protein product [Urochloa humidicola]
MAKAMDPVGIDVRRSHTSMAKAMDPVGIDVQQSQLCVQGSLGTKSDPSSGLQQLAEVCATMDSRTSRISDLQIRGASDGSSESSGCANSDQS